MMPVWPGHPDDAPPPPFTYVLKYRVEADGTYTCITAPNPSWKWVWNGASGTFDRGNAGVAPSVLTRLLGGDTRFYWFSEKEADGTSVKWALEVQPKAGYIDQAPSEQLCTVCFYINDVRTFVGYATKT
jgi:hypothetical protein